MVDLAILQTISYLIAALSFAVTCTYYIINLKNTQKNLKTTLETRQAQLFMQIYDHFLNATFLNNYEAIPHQTWENYEDYIEKYGPEKNPEAFNKFQTLTTFFQGVGILVERGLVDLGLIHDFASATTINTWEKLEPIVYGLRKDRGDQYILWAMEKLYRDVKRYRGENLTP